ncbi:MAG: alanine--tRNA ligase [Tissierellia bacterium]|nr:alanine--tRNA ligase [Tissierellia bacterium]
MKKIGLHELRKMYLEFFEEKGHLIHESYSLVPQNDKSLLLIGAGMAPLKKYFTGELVPPKTRMTTCQKCVRTGDIDNVGITDRHGTFFEMLGNFSFGDYFKKEAVEWAWEFLTERLEVNPEKLWATVYYEDDEAYNIWKDVVGVPEERIVRLGKEDNFWELEVGPSGPCSEIYVDRGEEHGCGCADCKPGCECDRFIEIWNLVFTQFDKDEAGVYHPLANPNIDTGMGLERMSTVLEVADNIFETTVIREIITKIEEIAKYKYKSDSKLDISVRVITDHIRAATFLASDGVLPSNEGRGYVMRRIIRRAARHGKLLGIEGSFLSELANVVINSWCVGYPELLEKKQLINDVISVEERKFQETIDIGMDILDEYIEELKANNSNQIDGEHAFKLYDTYGFPLDLTLELAREKDMTVDETGFKELMEQQRTRAREARDGSDNIGWSSQSKKEMVDYENSFVGYELLADEIEVVAIYHEGNSVDKITEGQVGQVVLKSTPFYGESGGQIGDTGTIKGSNLVAVVKDTQKTPNSTYYHVVEVTKGELSVADVVTAKVDAFRRGAIMRNHSATHLLHKALKEVLGEHVNQAGSEVGDDRARFDFTHYEAMTPEQIKRVEDLVNERILESLPVAIDEMSMPEANEKGAIGLFEGKYGDQVRVVAMGDFSVELCGGVHVDNTAQIGVFKITGESSVASGVRRVEYMTSMSVLAHDINLEEERKALAKVMKTTPQELIQKANAINAELKEALKEIEQLRKEKAAESTQDLFDNIQKAGDISYITKALKDIDANGLRDLVDQIKDKIGSGVVVLSSIQGEKLTFIAGVTKDLVGKGYNAGKIVKSVAQVTGGNGGGRPDMATAGGKDISKVDEALSKVKDFINS